MKIILLGKKYEVGELTKQRLIEGDDLRLETESCGYAELNDYYVMRDPRYKYTILLSLSASNKPYETVSSTLSVESCLQSLEKRLEKRKKQEERKRTPFGALQFKLKTIIEKYHGRMERPKDFVGYRIYRTVLGKDGRVTATLRTTGTANPILAFDLFQDSPVIRVNLLNFPTWGLDKELLDVIDAVKEYLNIPVSQRIQEFEEEIKSSDCKDIYASMWEDLPEPSGVQNQITNLLSEGE